jgi:hypothetical protein
MGFKLAVLLLVPAMVGVTEVPAGVLDEFTRFTAVSFLGVALLLAIFKTIPSMTTANTKAMEAVAEALTALRVHCAKSEMKDK